MFSGIIETTAEVVNIEKQGENVHFTFRSPITADLYIDQSIAHNGVCLTIVDTDGDHYTVTAIKETMKKTNLGLLQIGDKVNLERALSGHARMDGHIVQGHVDKTLRCIDIIPEEGSFLFKFKAKKKDAPLIVPKGSICLNGVSLTIVEARKKWFSVAIIPYTFEHTTFGILKKGDLVNVEYDIIGKYVVRYMDSLK